MKFFLNSDQIGRNFVRPALRERVEEIWCRSFYPEMPKNLTEFHQPTEHRIRTGD